MAIAIPELIIQSLVEGIFAHVKRDIEDATSDDEMILYKLFNGLSVGKRNYFVEAKDLFSRDRKTHPRAIETHLFFPKAQKDTPTVNIILPGEQSMYNEIGVGETGHEEDISLNADSSEYTPTYLRRFDGQLVVLITSDNHQETLLIYHLLKSMFISIFDASEFGGLQNPVLSGRDLAVNEMNNPPHLFTRALSIKHMHEVKVPRFFSSQEIGKIVLEGKAIISELE